MTETGVMIESRHGIRKAAILIDSLDEPTAEMLFGQMSAELALQVRAARTELGDVADPEREQVLAEFLDASWRPAPVVPPSPAEGIAGSLAETLSAQSGQVAAPASPASHNAVSARLGDDPTAALANGLAGEDAETICLVLGHLPPPRAADLLQRLPAGRQAEILQRLAQRETGPERSDDVVEESQRLFLGPQDDTRLPGVPSPWPGRLAPTPDPMPADCRSDGRRLNLPRSGEFRPRAASGEAELGEAPPLTDFDDLVRLEDAALARVFRAAEPQVVLLALSGANRELIDRIAGHLPPAAARTLRRQLTTLGPTRLRDIELAQQQLAELASQMCREGLIHVPSRRRFTMAA